MMTRRYYRGNLHVHSYEFSDDELYVRATVVSDAPHPNPTSAGDVQKAWVQPVTPPVHPKSEEC